MPFRPRELVVRARETATLLLRSLDLNEMVQRFLDMYAAEHRRPGRADHPGHYRDQLETIRREAIIAMVLRVEAALPKRLKVQVPVHTARRKKEKRRAQSRGMQSKEPRRRSRGWELAIPLLDLFREEFFVALGQALNWTQQDADEFWRDLELYEKARPADQRSSGRKSGGVSSGPFVDRVAFLLDASLLDQARRAASKFQGELETAADLVLRKVLSPRRTD
jgi:hypothetical protein